jgi:phosphatidate cytidylyltransferase
MALNWQTFRTRTISGVIFVALMLAAILWNQWSLLFVFSIVHFGCWWEYLKIVEKIRSTAFHPYIKLGFMVMGYGLMLWFCGPDYRINGYGIRENLSLPISAAGFVLLLSGIFQKAKVDLQSFGIAALGWAYISLSWGLLIDLYGREIDIHLHDTMHVISGQFFVIIVVAGMWMNDTMAYLVGSLIGKTPLTKISPKKTWEGTIGGIVMGVAITAFLFPWIFFSSDYSLSLKIIAPIATVAFITGTFGDLLESKLKRMAGLKDSGNMMPGHGGFLDRFDSLLVAIPFSWVLIMLLW